MAPDRPTRSNAIDTFEFFPEVDAVVEAKRSEDGKLYLKLTWKPSWLPEEIVLKNWSTCLQNLQIPNIKVEDADRQGCHSKISSLSNPGNGGPFQCLFVRSGCESGFESAGELARHSLEHRNEVGGVSDDLVACQQLPCSSLTGLDWPSEASECENLEKSKGCERSAPVTDDGSVLNAEKFNAPVRCPICLRTFVDADEFDKHCFVQCYARSSRSELFCKFCGKMFTYVKSLQAHTNLHEISLRHLDARTKRFKVSPGEMRSSKWQTKKWSYFLSKYRGSLPKPGAHKFAAVAMARHVRQNTILFSGDSSARSSQAISKSDFDSSSGRLETRGRPGGGEQGMQIRACATLPGDGVQSRVSILSFAESSNCVSQDDAVRGSAEVRVDCRVDRYIKGAWRRERALMQAKMRRQQQENPCAVYPSDPLVVFVNGRHGYKCRSCCKVSWNRFHHLEHYRLHTGEKPYGCEFCAKSFKQRSGWTRHIKNHHRHNVAAGPVPYSRRLQSYAHNDSRNGNARGNHLNEMHRFEDHSGLEEPPVAGSGCLTRLVFAGQNKSVFYVSEQLENQGTSPVRPALIDSALCDLPSAALSTVVLDHTRSDFEYEAGSAYEHAGEPYAPVDGVVNVRGVVPCDAFQFDRLPLPIRALSGNRGECDEHPLSKPEFQFKEVNAMDGSPMIIIKHHGRFHKSGEGEFAYVIDMEGNVTTRFAIGPETQGWKNVSLGKEALDDVRRNIQSYDDVHRRGRRVIDCDAEIKSRLQVVQKKVNDAPPAVAVLAASPGHLPASSCPEVDPLPSTGRSFRSGKEKRFSCRVCGKRFLAQAHVNEHMKIHTGEFPFKCMFCARPFRHKSGMNSHHKRHIKRGVFDRPIANRPVDAGYGSAGSFGYAGISPIRSPQEGSYSKHCGSSRKNSMISEHEKEICVAPMSSMCTIQTPEDQIGDQCKDSSGDSDYANDGQPPAPDVLCVKIEQETMRPCFPLGRGALPLETAAPTGDVVCVKSDPEPVGGASPALPPGHFSYPCVFCSQTFDQRTKFLKHLAGEHKQTDTSIFAGRIHTSSTSSP